MKVASGLASGPRPTPELAEEAVHAALAKAGLKRAEHVVLLLSRDFLRHPNPAVLAAARAAGCLQVAGCTSSGLFTEEGWQMDQPAAAALVVAESPPVLSTDSTPLVCFSGHGAIPYDWQNGVARFGLLEADAAAWSHGRVAGNGGAEFRLPGRQSSIALSTGLRSLGETLTVELSDDYELRRIGGQTAYDSMLRALPPELRQYPPLHHIVLQRQADAPATAILSANADGSLTLAAPLAVGENFNWAIRQPLAAEQDMRQALRSASQGKRRPDFALMFSCIGRGPLFYGDDDHDLLAFRQQFPEMPLLGAYGSGQIVPVGGGNRLFHNSVITLLFESADV